MVYGNRHRFFLRTIASQGVLSLTEARKYAEKYTDNGQIQIQDLVKQINDEIRPYQQEIKFTTHEVTGEDFVVFMSLGYDEVTKLQNVFNANELNYFRVLIEQILSTASRQITEEHATKKFDNIKLNKAEAQKLLNTWCRMYYLEREGQNYALGVRAVHEFESYFREHMPYIIEESSCSHCKKIVFRGYNCPGCDKSIHTRCLNNYLRKVKKWPCCKIDYNDEQLEVNEESSRSEHTQQISETQRSVAYDVIDVPDDGESIDDVVMTDVEAPGPSHRVTRKRKRMAD